MEEQEVKNRKKSPNSRAHNNSHHKKDNEALHDKELIDVLTLSKKKNEIVNYTRNLFKINFEIDLISLSLLILGLLTRMYQLEQPRNIVFDELHYGKYIALYMKNTFFFDSHPPLGKQLIASVAHLAGFNGNFKFDKIGSLYPDSVPLLALRVVPALFGSLIIPASYHLMLESGASQWTSILAALLLLLDNSLLTQSRFILMETMLIFFTLVGLLCLLKFSKIYHSDNCSFRLFFWLSSATVLLTCALSVKYVGFYSLCLAFWIISRDFWRWLACPNVSDRVIVLRFILQTITIACFSLLVYLTVFYVHLKVLHKAGPHDSIMTSAFQASLEGGLASITKGQPLLVAHGSQITLRHSHGRTCWLHSHNHVYPIKYPDKRGSSHQQQVTCYSFKDVNNWWIVKRPDKNDLVVEGADVIKHGDVIQLVHGITSRALNSHDVAAPVSPQCQEVSCYIDYNVSMPARNLWRVEILNRDQNGDDTWYTIQSLVRLIHVETNTALKFTGRQLPDWGFHQHEVVTDRIINQDDTIWNVEEHRYTKSENQKDRERELVAAEMIPTSATSLSFWEKLLELHYKMLFSGTESVQNHMYSSEPLEWPLMSRGIAYWVSQTSNAQIHLIGNLILWYSGTIALVIYVGLLVFYLLRRHRQCYDLSEEHWLHFRHVGDVFLAGYLFHFVPYFFVERTLFLHHYFPAFIFKILLLAHVIEHLYCVIRDRVKYKLASLVFILGVLVWLVCIFSVFKRFSVLCYGIPLSTNEIINLRWKDTWDFIVHQKN